MTTAEPRPGLTGIWLTAEPIVTPIESLLLDMIAPRLPSVALREAEIEEMRRGVKLESVVLEYLGLRPTGVDTDGEIPLRLVSPKASPDPWRDALVSPGGERPIGFSMSAGDAVPLVIVHEVFTRFGEAEKDLVRRYAARAARGESHPGIVAALRTDPGFARTLDVARRSTQFLDPSVLFSPDATIRVQLGSVSQTTKDILREGLHGTQIFVLPASLYEAKINYGDVEFLVYLNFFLRKKMRTLIVGTEQQRHILHRLLTLTLFGLFDPSAATQPSFEDLRKSYGVQSRETYDFLRAAYEIFGVRRDASPDSPLLGIDDYVNFITLDALETVVPVPSAEVRVISRGRGVEVRIVQADGREVDKLLELTPPKHPPRAIPDELRRALQFASDRPRFGVTPLGTSHGFDHAGDFTCFIIWVNGKGILVDPSPEAMTYLGELGIAELDVPYVLLTHVHSDHDGGLVAKLISGSRTAVIASDPVFRSFAEKAQLVTGHDFEREGLVGHIPANPGRPVQIEIAGEAVRIETRWNLHPIPTNGLKVTVAGRVFGYSGDTQYDPAMLERLRAAGTLPESYVEDLLDFLWTRDGQPLVDFLYHEAGLPPIHTDKENLRVLSPAITERMRLVHIADRDVPPGFSPGKPVPFQTQVLLPSTPHSRERSLLEPMRLVAYLYDIPSETLETLLRGAEVVTHAPETVIVHKGPVSAGEKLDFHIVTEGQVSVRDGSRVIATLFKSDTFGEWGISHQRGFRVADVVADRTSQTIRLSADQYRWLVDRHPIVQDRLSKIRTLLPRLHTAQALARLKAETEVGAPSVIGNMSASQLSSLAMFGTVQSFKQGEHIVVQGDPADGFYIVMAGHLKVEVHAGQVINEMAEGDVFGELGLLEGGTRGATVTVVSSDAEVLFLSTRGFRDLLSTVPAFAWGIWETAGRRERRRSGSSMGRSTPRKS